MQEFMSRSPSTHWRSERLVRNTSISKLHKFQAGLPDGLFSNQKFEIWVNFGGPLHGKCWYILWPLEYFMAICYNLWPFGIVCVHLLYFFPIWNVWTKKNLATLVSSFMFCPVWTFFKNRFFRQVSNWHHTKHWRGIRRGIVSACGYCGSWDRIPPVYFLYPKSQFFHILEGYKMEMFTIIYSLLNFMAIWFILWHCGIFYMKLVYQNLVYFIGLWCRTIFA
jgi:hypothetical protein